MTCAWCGTRFTPAKRVQRFCSKQCAGKYQWRGHVRAPRTWATHPPVDSAHRKLRRELLPLALGQPCPTCGRIMDKTAQLDHIVPRARGGQTTRENCRILCAPCNGKRGQVLGGKTAALAKRRQRLTRRDGHTRA
jgi:5-methylcytosine-specific restriction endonuclease McrA